MFPFEVFRDTLGKAVAIFQRHSIPYHLTGGITSVLYGEPRMTQDIDIVLDNRAIASQIEPFLLSLANSDFLFDAATIRREVERGGMFQLFDNCESLKLDLYPREMIAGELGRSQLAEVYAGMQLPVASRADVAASKLAWINKGSHKSRRDLRQIYRTSSEADRVLIHNLATQLGLEALLAEVLAEPNELRD
jgi:hypothetical protein